MGKDLTGKELGSGIVQRKDGNYCARFDNRFGVRQSIYDKSLTALKRKLKDEQKKDLSHTNVIKDFTLDEWFKNWFSVYKVQIRDNSKRHYRQVYTKHISPDLGMKQISQITTIEIKSLINKLKKAGYQFETQNKVRILLVDMFNKALLDDFVVKNPVLPVKVVRDEKNDRRILTVDEQTEFFDTCKGTFYDELFNVAVLTGLRPGELFALRLVDINFTKREISVTRTLVYQKYDSDEGKEFHIEPPKTKSSIRKVKFNDRCEKYLRAQIVKKHIISAKRTAKPLVGLEDLLFITKYDTPLNSVLYSAAIKRVVDMINESRSDLCMFEDFSGHTFRHVYATRCFEAGVAPKVVQTQLGHATLDMTMNLYTHVLDDAKDRELEKFYQASNEILDNPNGVADVRYSHQSEKVVSLDHKMV